MKRLIMCLLALAVIMAGRFINVGHAVGVDLAADQISCLSEDPNDADDPECLSEDPNDTDDPE